MARILKVVLAALAAFFAVSALAQPAPLGRGEPQQPFAQAELDQMLAPIALYPDSLLSHILAAAANPRDVFEAAAWLRTHQDLRGEAAVDAARYERWDPSVVSLTAFPDVLAMMDERRYWTEKLGEAFIEQQGQVMDTVQQLRARADGAGNLRSGDELLVERRGEDYVIEPASPEMVYVPYYDARTVYGSWWWPDYPPVYWNPWPGYRYYAGYPFGWGYGVRLGSAYWLGAFDWPRRYLRYSHYRPWYYQGRDWRRGDRWYTDRTRYWASRDGRWRDGDRRWDGRTVQGDRYSRSTAPVQGDRYSRSTAPVQGDRYYRQAAPTQGDRYYRSPAPTGDSRWQGRDGRSPDRETRETQVYRNPVTRPVAPMISGDGAPRTMRQRVAPAQEQRAAPVRSEPAANPAARSAPAHTERQAAPERSRGEDRSSRGDRGNRTQER